MALLLDARLPTALRASPHADRIPRDLVRSAVPDRALTPRRMSESLCESPITRR